MNLVATQLVLERDYPNRLVFDPAHGLDPTLHLSLRGAQARPAARRPPPRAGSSVPAVVAPEG